VNAAVVPQSPATGDLFAVRDGLVDRMASAIARIIFKHQIERHLESWRPHEGMMRSWGATDAECKAAAERALPFARVSPHAPQRAKAKQPTSHGAGVSDA